MSGEHNTPEMASEGWEQMKGAAEAMEMKPGDSATPHLPELLSSENLSSGGIFLLGSLLVLGVLFVRHSPIARWVKGPILSSLLSKKTLGLGVFAMLTGGILMGTNQLKPASSTMEMHEGHNMSHDEMMAVDGSFNPTPVRVEAVNPRLLEARVQYTGSIHPYLAVTVYPRVAGQLRDYSVYPGDRVVAGQVLAQLSAAELTTEVAEAVAEADTRQTALDMSKIEVDEQRRTIEQIEADLAYLEKKLERFALLVQEGAISQDGFDVVESEAKAKQAAQKEAQMKLVRLEAKVVNERAKINQAQAKVRTTSVMEGYTTITSPITGIVQERLADPGVVVQPGMGILKIGDYNRLRLQANVAQQDAIAIRVGSPILAAVPGTGIKPIRGKITSIFPQTDNQTRTVTVEAVVDNPGGQLQSGQFLEMGIITARQANALSVPQSALVDFKDRPAVWVVEGDVARRKSITLGMVSGERVEVTSGLKPGDLVITSGQQRLIDNSPVTAIDEAGQPIAATPDRNQGGVQIQLVSPSPPQAVTMGDAQLLLEVQDAKTGQPLKVENLEVSATMPMKNMAPMTAKVEVNPARQAGRFQANTYLGMRGAWKIDVKVKDPQHKGQASFYLDVR